MGRASQSRAKCGRRLLLELHGFPIQSILKGGVRKLRRIEGPRNVAALVGLWLALIVGALLFLQSMGLLGYYATNVLNGGRYRAAVLLGALPLVSLATLVALIVMWRKRRTSARQVAVHVAVYFWAFAITGFFATVLYVAPKVLLGR